jgi:hypothetical protein
MSDTTAPHGTIAGTPVLAAPVTNDFGLGDAGSNASPSFADIDGDGDLDAFIGNNGGNTLVYLSTGSAGSPDFVLSGTNLYGLGGVGASASPSFADIDGDGDLDAFIGAADGNTQVYLNTGSAGNPAFVLSGTNLYGLGDAGDYANPSFADIDSDGDLDALIGDVSGNTQVFLNTGSAGNPAFVLSGTTLYGLGDVGDYASPSFADIDGDGDLEAFIGNQDGNTLVYLNTGSFIGAPVRSTTPNGSYGIGRVITLTVGFSESVLVAGGVPTLLLETGTTDRLATYSGGSGTNKLTFTYTVQAGDTAADLDFTSTSALVLNGATLQDAAGNNAVLTLAAPGAYGSLAANAALVIDGFAPGATLAGDLINNAGSATVQSTEAGTAYLVNTTVTVSDLASITGAPDASWNSVAVAANSATALAATGLGDGSYRLYTADAAGNLSTVSAATVTVDGTAPTATLAAATLTNTSTGTATVQSTEAGTAYLVSTTVTVSGLASITSAPDVRWNSVAVVANSATALAATGLRDGSYKLYTTDAAGNLSAASTASVIIDTTAPHGTLASGAPVFSGSVTNDFGLGSVGTYASPSLADIDGDGDRDAFIGNRDGNTRVFLNIGSDDSPAFMLAGTNQYGLGDVGYFASPSFGDIDADGDLDAFVGNNEGNTQVYLNTGSAASPAFVLSVTNLYGLGDAGISASPSFADIDGDGDRDAFIGNRDGNTQVYLNTGSASSPAFMLSGANLYGLGDVGGSASPSFADIDGDGDLDAFIGNNAGNTLVYLSACFKSHPVRHRASLASMRLIMAR